MSLRENPWAVLLSVALGQFMVVVDVTILNIALPTIAEDFDASMAGIEWAIIAYALAMVGLVPAFGRVSDVLGRKRLYVTGLVLFALGSALAAASPFIEFLIGARVVQAVGGAFITSNTFAILTDTFPAGRRGVAMGIQSILISGGAAIGPTLGGFLVTNLGWEWVFLVNLPVGGVAALVALVVLPPLRSERAREPVDWLGAGLLLVALCGLLLGVTKAPVWGWADDATLTALGAGALFFTAFVLRELRVDFPLVLPSLFRIRAFVAGQLAGMFATLALVSMVFLLPFYWQGLRGYSAQTAGLLMLPLPLSIMVTAPVAGRISDLRGARGIATAGLCLVAVGMLLMSRIGAETAVPNVLWRFAVFGTGLGMFLAPNSNAVMSSVPAAHRGVASGLLALFRFSGQSAGIAFGGTVFVYAAGGGSLLEPATMARLGDDPALFASFRGAFEQGFHTVCLATVPIALVGAGLSWGRGE